MFCAQCGKQLPDGAKFCPVCGTNLQGGATPAEKPKRGGGLKFVAAGLVVVAVAAGSYAMLVPAPAEKPAAAPPPKPAIETAAPEPKSVEKAPEKPPEPAPAPVAEPQNPAPDPAEVTAAHKALDQKITDEEAAAKSHAQKK